jgi:hypothetical protein
MPVTSNQTGPTWEQFRLKHNCGKQKKEQFRESKKKREKTTPRKEKQEIKNKKASELQQQSIKGDNITRDDAEAFADSMKTKQGNTIRIALQNIQLLPENSRHYKSRQLIDYIAQAELDALLMNEVGLNWRSVSADNQWVERTTGKLFGSKAVFAHNTTELDITDTIQYGGVGIVATQELAHRTIGIGGDPTIISEDGRG